MRNFLVIPVLLSGLVACAGTPNDVSPTLTGLGPGPLDNRPIGQIGTAEEAGATSGTGATDVTAIAEGAIARAEAEGAAAPTGGVFDNLQPQQASDVLPPPLIPRVAAFALRTTHQPGQRQWRRNPLRRDGQSICSQYQTRDEAQDRFLRDGGPERDPNGMDPDGDGFVCGFDPSALRAEAAEPATNPFEALPAIGE